MSAMNFSAADCGELKNKRDRGYPLVSRNGMLAVCKKKFAIRYLASITRVH
jgi:hypothetical protein